MNGIEPLADDVFVCMTCDIKGAATKFHEETHTLVRCQPQAAPQSLLSMEQRIDLLETRMEARQDAIERRLEDISAHLLRIQDLLQSE